MNHYDFATFVKSIENLSWHEMIGQSIARCTTLERSSYGVKGAVNRREHGSTILAEKIKGLLFWLYNGVKPAGLSDEDFQLLRTLCERLVEKQQLKPDALEVFDA